MQEFSRKKEIENQEIQDARLAASMQDPESSQILREREAAEAENLDKCYAMLKVLQFGVWNARGWCIPVFLETSYGSVSF